ncbi:MAG: ferredoxin, partial [Roseiarcus sp.]
LGALALFPFGGPPFWPFQQWARRSEPVHPSPIGLLIHPRYGLWHSYRGGLGFREALDVPELAAAPSPCDSCRGRWCLNTCPVGAFSGADYDVAACAGHLEGPAGEDCMNEGCRARRACPVGAAYVYGPDQASFTMRAFLRVREAR